MQCNHYSRLESTYFSPEYDTVETEEWTHSCNLANRQQREQREEQAPWRTQRAPRVSTVPVTRFIMDVTALMGIL